MRSCSCSAAGFDFSRGARRGPRPYALSPSEPLHGPPAERIPTSESALRRSRPRCPCGDHDRRGLGERPCGAEDLRRGSGQHVADAPDLERAQAVTARNAAVAAPAVYLVAPAPTQAEGSRPKARKIRDTAAEGVRRGGGSARDAQQATAARRWTRAVRGPENSTRTVDASSGTRRHVDAMSV